MELVGIGSGVRSREAEDLHSPRLVHAAHEFEGQMMKELLKSLTSSDALIGKDEDADSGTGSGGALSEFATETLGQSLSEQGGFGIANRIIQQLSHSSNTTGNGNVTRNPDSKTRSESLSMTKVMRRI